MYCHRMRKKYLPWSRTNHLRLHLNSHFRQCFVEGLTLFLLRNAYSLNSDIKWVILLNSTLLSTEYSLPYKRQWSRVQPAAVTSPLRHSVSSGRTNPESSWPLSHNGAYYQAQNKNCVQNFPTSFSHCFHFPPRKLVHELDWKTCFEEALRTHS